MTCLRKLVAFVLILTVKSQIELFEVDRLTMGKQEGIKENQGFGILSFLEKRESDFKTDKIRPRLGKRFPAYRSRGNLCFNLCLMSHVSCLMSHVLGVSGNLELRTRPSHAASSSGTLIYFSQVKILCYSLTQFCSN